MGLLSPGYGPHGVVAIVTDLDDTAYIGDTETMVYQLPFLAAPKRIYKVQLRVGRADTYSQGDASTRPAKNSLIARCRWAAGSSVTTSGSNLGDFRVTVFNDMSDTATGLDASWFLVSPPAGQLTVGISIWAARASATYGTVRFLADGNAHFVVEDVGPYSE